MFDRLKKKEEKKKKKKGVKGILNNVIKKCFVAYILDTIMTVYYTNMKQFSSIN